LALIGRNDHFWATGGGATEAERNQTAADREAESPITRPRTKVTEFQTISIPQEFNSNAAANLDRHAASLLSR